MIWNALLLLTGLALWPGHPASSLTLSNVRLTYGILGPVRSNDQFLPGDSVVLSFDIEGATVDSDGKVRYAIGMEVMDKTGKVRFHQLPKDRETDAKPGVRLPACVNGRVGFHQAPGTYTIKVTVTDRSSNAAQQLSRDVEVLPKSFGLVRFTLTRDEEGNLPVATLNAGQPAWINFALVGFARDPGQNNPDVGIELQAADEAGNYAFKEPIKGAISAGVPKQAEDIPMRLELRLAQPGNYKLQLKAQDKVSGKSAVLELPVKVQSSS